jgi:hypothetical protein
MSIARKLMRAAAGSGSPQAALALFLDQLGEGAAEMRQRGIGSDREQLELGIGIEHFLLPFDDALVLEEPFDQALVQRFRDAGVGPLEVVQVVPEEVRRAPRLRRHELAVAVFARAFKVAFLGALPCRREQRFEHEDAGDLHVADVAPVDAVVGIRDHLAMERRRLGVHVPALDAKAVRQPLHRGRTRHERVFLRTAERLRVDEREVREVAQVVDDEQPVGLVVHVVGHALPLRVVEVRKVEDLRRVGLGGLAHPDPEQALALGHGVAAHTEAGRDHVLPGNLHAAAGAVELEAVIEAAHAVAFAPPIGQQRTAVATTVVERHHGAALPAVEQHRLLEQGATEQAPPIQLVTPAGHVPAVLQEHPCLLAGRARPSMARAAPPAARALKLNGAAPRTTGPPVGRIGRRRQHGNARRRDRWLCKHL